MKTLSDLKRDIKVLDKIQLVKIEQGNYIERGLYTPLVEVAIKPAIAMLRRVTYKDTTGIYLKDVAINDMTKGSFCGWPKAKELEYNGDTFIINEYDTTGVLWQKRTYKII